MKKSNVLSGLAVLSLVGFLASCEQLDNMKNMNNKTNELATTSDKIANRTEEVLDVSNQLRRNTGDLYHQARSKEAEETRQRARDALRLESSFEEKITRAAIYHKSFEFQLWTNGNASERDDKKFREELMLESMEEFFRTVQSFYEEIGSDHDISPASTDNAARALFALAVTMHELHHEQKRLVSTKSINEVTMLSMIENTLLKADKLASGELSLGDFKAYEVAILENEPSARNLLRMRFDILSAMVLAKVSKINDPNQGTLAGLATQARLYLRSWDSQYPELNVAQKHQVETFLTEALRVKGILKKLKMDSTLESKLASIYGNMKLPTPNSNCTDCVPRNDVNPLQIHQTQIKSLLSK